MRLVLHAPNVHQGGGRALLLPLIAAGRDHGLVRAFLDARLDLPAALAEGIQVQRVRPSLTGRLAAEYRLAAGAAPGDTVLCFGNLPPLLPVAGRVCLFLQNRYLVARRSHAGLPRTARVRLALERRWLRARLAGVDRVIVQSPSMRREVREALGVEAAVLPFAAEALDFRRGRPGPEQPASGRYDFLYVASGEPHKNHRRLVQAWALLAREGLRPSLCLTLDPPAAPALCGWIEAEARREGLTIELAAPPSSERVRALYGEARALIYPSAFESLGLPLVEARVAGLPILAAERDYVRDLVDPEETFDPDSAVSIARAVKRFLGQPEGGVALRTPGAFLEALQSL
jgi:glycosyltransferase involved in cell wall biosynthesis